MIKIESKRLIIRDHLPDDLFSLHTLLSDPKVMFYLPDIRTHSMHESNKNLKTALQEAKKQNNRGKNSMVLEE